jgi:NAD(P)H-dependent FMN reductase
MNPRPRILAFAGSARRESLNRRLLGVAAAAVQQAGGEVTLIDLNDYELPLYHGDLEAAQGLPPAAGKLSAEIQAHAGLLIASPEYNSFITPLLKNTLDWCTRGEGDPFAGRAAAVVSASPGAYGGIRSLQHARHLLLHLGCHVVPSQCSLPRAHEAFDESGGLKDKRSRAAVEAVAVDLVRLATRLAREA